MIEVVDLQGQPPGIISRMLVGDPHCARLDDAGYELRYLRRLDDQAMVWVFARYNAVPNA